VTQALKQIHADKTINNLEREVVLMKFKNDAILTGKVDDLSKNPRLRLIDQREQSCFKPFEDGLRARDVHVPEPCKNLLEPNQESTSGK
jgi:hypothetical protein